MFGWFDDYMLFQSISFIIAYSQELIFTRMISTRTCAHTWMPICVQAWRLKWSCTWIFECLNILMIVLKSYGSWTIRCICTLRLFCSCALLISCSLVYLLWQSYALTSTGIYDHMFLCSHLMKFANFYVHVLCWSYTSMFPCFDNCMLQCQHALKRTCSLSYMP